MGSSALSRWWLGPSLRLVFASNLLLSGESWSEFRGGPQRTGVSSLNGATNNLTNWKFLMRGPTRASPTVAGDGSILATSDEAVYSVEADGTFRWVFELEGGVVDSTPCVVDALGLVVFGGWDGAVYGLRLSDGSRAWKKSMNDQPIFSSIVADSRNQNAYVGLPSGYLVAFRLKDGETVWRYATEALEAIWSSPALSESEDLVYVGGMDNYVHAVRTSSGERAWRFETGGFDDDPDDPDVISSPAVAGGRVYVGSRDNRVHCLDGQTGAKVWSYATKDDVISSAAADHGLLFVASKSGLIHAIRQADGTLEWSVNLGAAIYSEPVIDARRTLFVGADDGKLYALEAATGRRLWSHDVGDAIRGEPAILEGSVVVATLHASAVLYSIGTPDKQESRHQRSSSATGGWSTVAVVFVTLFACLLASVATRYAVLHLDFAHARSRGGHRGISLDPFDPDSSDVSFVEMSDTYGEYDNALVL